MSGGQIAVIVVAVLVGATVKSVTGMGLPIIAIPIISLFTSAETAVAVLAIPNALQNVALVARNVGHRHETVALGRLAGFGVAGAIVGSLALGVVPDDVALAVLAALLVFYLVTSIRRPDVHVAPSTARRWSPAVGVVGGIFQGGVGISGPIVGTWHHALGLARGAFVLSVSTMFLITGATQVTVFATTGKLDGRLLVSASIAVLVLVTVPFGERLRDRLSGRAFDRAVIGLLAISCVGIVADLVT